MVVVVAVVVACCLFRFVWVTWPLLSLVGTYFQIVHPILAHMAQQLSMYFNVNAIGTIRCHMFKSETKQMFFFFIN